MDNIKGEKFMSDECRLVVGLDLSLTATGIVALAPSNAVYLDIIKARPECGQGIRRASVIAAAVLTWIETHAGAVVAIEGYSFGSPMRMAPLGELGGMVRRDLLERDITWLEVPPTCLKKFATGKGNSPKDVVMREVFKRWGFEHNDNNVVDAYVLARMGWLWLAPQGGPQGTWKTTTAQKAAMKAVREGT